MYLVRNYETSPGGIESSYGRGQTRSLPLGNARNSIWERMEIPTHSAFWRRSRKGSFPRSRSTIALVPNKYRSPLIAQFSLFLNQVALPLEPSGHVREIVFASVRLRLAAHYQDQLDGAGGKFNGEIQPPSSVRSQFPSSFYALRVSLHVLYGNGIGLRFKWITISPPTLLNGTDFQCRRQTR